MLSLALRLLTSFPLEAGRPMKNVQRVTLQGRCVLVSSDSRDNRHCAFLVNDFFLNQRDERKEHTTSTVICRVLEQFQSKIK